jgi:hypothetical protein
MIATGLSLPSVNLNMFDLYVKELPKHYSEYSENFFIDNINQYKNKSVCIFGNGNSAYELANLLNPLTSKILIYSNKQNTNWALSSHYVGDIRSIYLPFIDTFSLKSLNAINHFVDKNLKIKQENIGDSYKIYNCNCCDSYDEFDHIIFCSGWKFDPSIFDFDVKLNENLKYPMINSKFQSINNDNLYFIGGLMHVLDYKKGSGGFIHGFRYLIKLLFKINYDIPHEIKYFNINNVEDINILINFILDRLNTSSDIYQMYGFLGDIFLYNSKNKTLKYYSNINIVSNIINDYDYDIRFILKLDYGDVITNILSFDKQFSSLGNENYSTFLHPIIKITDNKNNTIDIVHFIEDLYANFYDKKHYFDKFIRLFKSYF